MFSRVSDREISKSEARVPFLGVRCDTDISYLVGTDRRISPAAKSFAEARRDGGAAMQAMETVGQIGPIEVPTPAHAVRLRRPVCLTATYVVACTALLVSVSLLPFGSGATAPVANARGDRERAGPVVERRERASSTHDAREGNRPSAPPDGRDSEPAAGETRTLSDAYRRSTDEGEASGEASGEADAREISEPPLEDRCVFHVYRHLSKTGGTTVRFVFDRQTVFGDFEYPLEYGFDEKKWDDVLVRWRKKADAFLSRARATRSDADSADSAPPPRTLIEIRGNWPSNWAAEAFPGRILSDVEALRAAYGPGAETSGDTDDATRPSCSVTTSLMLRDPLKQYESFWRYYIEKKQQSGDATNDVRTGGVWPNVEGAAFWGDSFAEWASRVPSMQIREALGDKCVTQMRQPGFDAELKELKELERTADRPSASNGANGSSAPSTPGKETRRDSSVVWVRTGNHSFDSTTCDVEVTETDFARFEALARRVDVVGVTERFDAFLLRLGEVVGLRRLEYVKSNAAPKRKEEKSGETSGTESSGTSSSNEALARRVVAEVASWDFKAHALAERAQTSEIARNAVGGEAGFARRLAAFEEKTVVAANGATFVGGAPARSPYVWVKSGDVEASGGTLKPVTPSSFTDESGGGQAVAYFVFDPVTLVRRDDAERAGAACVKGCTFDAPPRLRAR